MEQANVQLRESMNKVNENHIKMMELYKERINYPQDPYSMQILWTAILWSRHKSKEYLQ